MKNIYLISTLLLYFTMAKAQELAVEFTTNGTYTVPDGVEYLIIEVVGAGGSGGNNGGGGGGGGGYAIGSYILAPQQVLNVVIGVGGSGLGASTTSVDNLISATGGENGYSVSNPEIGGGGAGGMGMNGNIANYSGGAGGGGYYTYFGGGGGGAGGATGPGGDGGNTILWTGQCLTPGGDGGPGGGFPGGPGGKGAGFTDEFCTVSDPVQNGFNYGGGGGGENGIGTGNGTGANGYARIYHCSFDTDVVVNEGTLSASQSGVTYQWIDCNLKGAPIEGETSMNFTPTENGVYAVQMFYGVCSTISECVDFVVDSQFELEDKDLVVYPNPFNDKIRMNNSGNYAFVLLSTTGKTMMQGPSVSRADFSELEKGLYILKLVNEGKAFSVIKE